MSKVDIYGDEWLDVVFENRNKTYGAYYLRKHYAATVLKALALTFGSIAAVIFGMYWFFKPTVVVTQPVPLEVSRVFYTATLMSPPVDIIAHQQRHHSINGHTYAIAPAVAQRVALPMPLAASPVIENTTLNVQPPEIAAATPATVADNNIYPAQTAEVKPCPMGGVQGWMSFLQRNLTYPQSARREGISGKVWLSFVVEKDGSISDITVDSPAGYGFDEEAIRVLKESPLWQPGIKDGQLIRIRYKLPISFQMDR